MLERQERLGGPSFVDGNNAQQKRCLGVAGIVAQQGSAEGRGRWAIACRVRCGRLSIEMFQFEFGHNTIVMNAGVPPDQPEYPATRRRVHLAGLRIKRQRFQRESLWRASESVSLKLEAAEIHRHVGAKRP